MHVRRLLRIFLISILGILVVTVVAVVSLFIYEPTPAEGFGFSSAGKTIQLSDGRTLAYLDIGDPKGRPVFFFHGGPGSRLQGLLFEEFNQQLGIRLIVPDRPGYGLSDFQENRTYLDWSSDVSELADQLGIGRFAVLGYSSGGPYVAAVAHDIPQRLTVAAIVAGEGPYASDDFPREVLSEDIHKLLIWSANNGPWLMHTLFTIARIQMFNDPTGFGEDAVFDMSAKDEQFFRRDFRQEFSAEAVEALRQGVKGWTREYTIERLDWPFELEAIHAPTVLVFLGKEDTLVSPRIGEYVCMRIPSCTVPTIYPGEAHSVVYYRYEQIIQAMLEVWD